MRRAVVIADDLTGALDTGVRFADEETRVRVLSGFVSDRTIHEALDDPGTQVLVVNTRSRHDSPGTAGSRVRALASAIRAFQTRNDEKILVYKKCDSTLRGNIGAELEALASVFPESGMAFIPAFPELGRTTKNGIHFVRGVPVALTSFGADELNPVLSSSIPEIIGSQSKIPVHVSSVSAFCSKPVSALESGGIIAIDATSDADFERIADALSETETAAGFPLLAGSAGFASRLPGLCGMPRSARPGCPLSGPFLVMIGSRNEVSRAQADLAIESGFEEVVLPARTEIGVSLPEETEAIERTATIVAAGKDCVVRTQDPGIPAAVRLSMAELVAAVFRRTGRFSLVVSGGDTLEAVLDILDIPGTARIEPKRELAPGIVFAEAETRAGMLPIITKAGGFGARDLLLHLKNLEEKRTCSV